MIPLQIQIKNFLSYGPEIQTIDFSSYPLICLSGKNGHGKSALLDAITWAIWGQARKTMGNAKADQGLLRLGQTQMMVCLDFICNGQTYRVRREFAQTYGKPYAVVDFGILDKDADKVIPLTTKTIRDTQAAIEGVLHLTYDAFINSAFLRQGQSNEFSKKLPRERKDILASILGLDQYEVIRKRAAEKVKEAQTRKGYCLAIKQKIEQELESEPIITEQLQFLSEKQQKIAVQEQTISQRTARLNEQKKLVHEQEQQLHMLVYKQQHTAEQEAKLQSELRILFAQWRAIHKQQLAAQDYSALELQKKELIDHVKQFQSQLQQQLQCKEQILKFKELLAKIVHEFQEKQHTQLTNKKIACERLAIEKHHLEAQLATIQKQLAHMPAEIDRKQQLLQILTQQTIVSMDTSHVEKQFEKRKEHYQRWIAQANMISAELETTDQKYALVQDEQSPSCPLCEQNLSASRRRFLIKNFDTHTQFLKHRLAKLTNLIKSVKAALIEQHAQLEQFKKNKSEQEKRETEIAEIKKSCDALLQLQQEQRALTAKITEQIHIVQTTLTAEQRVLEQSIAQGKNELLADHEYQEAKKNISELETNIQAIKYDASKHEHVNQQLQRVERSIHSFQALQQEIHQQIKRAQDIAHLCQQLKLIKNTKQVLALDIAKFAELPYLKRALEQEESELAKTITELAGLKDQLSQERGTLEAYQQKLAQLKVEYKKQKDDLAACEKTIDDYQAIALATSKDGIQALLIEDAIPEIEQETNELLAKLTDNQTQLFIESLRDLKKGGTKETLDIKISDAVGIRPYEMFSGGEAFRIDFALRIAISKLLARRAGTSLQTLIIDEGFGSQDEEGLSHIMDALYKIQDDFAKIIIVSHLATMKNQFPVHFFIEKGANGSNVQVIEQG